MERALMIWDQCRKLLRRLGAQRKGPRQQYSNSTILLLELWAALSNQTAKWACRSDNWPGRLPPGGLPSPSAFSRRARSDGLQALRERLEALIGDLDRLSDEQLLLLITDAHAMAVARHSQDRQASYGRGAGCMAVGYKVQPVMDIQGRVLTWRLSPMNTDESVMLGRMLRTLGREGPLPGYLLADASYNDNWLFAQAATLGLQLIAPRRRPGTGLGHRRHEPERVHAMHMLEPPVRACASADFGREVYAHRTAIERCFGHWASTPELKLTLPTWIRGFRRVKRWVACKIIAIMLDRLIRTKPHLLKLA